MSLASAELGAHLKSFRSACAGTRLSREDELDAFGRRNRNGKIEPRVPWPIRVAGKVSFDHTLHLPFGVHSDNLRVRFNRRNGVVGWRCVSRKRFVTEGSLDVGVFAFLSLEDRAA